MGFGFIETGSDKDIFFSRVKSRRGELRRILRRTTSVIHRRTRTKRTNSRKRQADLTELTALNDSHVVVYLMSCSPQSTQYLFLSIRALACDCSLHCLAGIFSLTTLPQLGQKRTGGFVSRWLRLGHAVMFILIPVG